MTTGSAPSSPAYTILVVCTGNICRSPLAQLLLQSRFDAVALDVRVVSAGTEALVGEGATSESAALAVHYGVAEARVAHHAATQLTASMVAAADLILTASHEHSHAVARLNPRSARFTFTIAQFARFVDYLAAEPASTESETDDSTQPVSQRDRFIALIDEVVLSRGMVPPPADPTADDVEDPYRQPQHTYDRVGAILDTAVAAIVAYFLMARDSSADGNSQ